MSKSSEFITDPCGNPTGAFAPGGGGCGAVIDACILRTPRLGVMGTLVRSNRANFVQSAVPRLGQEAETSVCSVLLGFCGLG